MFNSTIQKEYQAIVMFHLQKVEQGFGVKDLKD